MWPVSADSMAMAAVSRIADLTDQDDVGVLAKDGAKAGGEGHARPWVDVRLRDAVELVLDRVLDGDDVARDVVQVVQRRVERGRLARTRGAGDEDHALRLADTGQENLQRRLRDPRRLRSIVTAFL